jgi:hypothetical protein
MQTMNLFDTLLHMNRLRLSYKAITVNYIGGLGYYSLLAAFMLWVSVFIAKLQQLIVDPGVRQLTDSSSPANASHISSTASSGSPLIIFSYVILAVTLAGLAALPYYVGKLSSHTIKRLLFMTGKPVTYAHAHKLRQILCVLFIGAVIVTGYDFARPASGNIYVLLIMGLGLLSIIWFFIQKTLVHVWKLEDQSIY